MNAFITGSHAYGEPGEESDIDLVVLVDSDTQKLLIEHGGKPTRFGKLNIIAVDTQAKFDKWKKGTEALQAIRPVDRESAVAVFKALGVSKGDSGKRRLYPSS